MVRALIPVLFTVVPALLWAQELTPRNATMIPGDHRVWIAVGEFRREYLVHVPHGYDEQRRVPVVFMFHGSGGSLDEISRSTGWSAKADAETFLAVYPNGFPNADGMRVWNDGRRSEEGQPDDVAFVRTMLEDLAHRFRVDDNRVYVVGFSNGAGLAYRLAAELGDQVAAIAPVAGRFGLSIDSLARAVPAIAIVGTLDPGFAADSRAAERWARLARCGGVGEPKRDGRYQSVVFQQCPKDVEVHSWTVDSAAHYWPGGINRGFGMWAEKTIWAFFRKHPLR